MEESTAETTGVQAESQEEYVEPTENETVEEVATEGEEEVVAEQPETSGDKLGADDRKAQIAGEIQALISERNEVRQKIQQLEQHFQQTQQAKEPEFIEVTPQVQQQINNAIMQLEQQRAEAELDGDYLRAQGFRRQVDEILRGVEENNVRREQALRTRQQQQQESSISNAINERAEMFRQVHNIPQEQWIEANKWFYSECQANPLLKTQYQEIARMQGPTSAVQFAASYVNNNWQKPAQQAKAQKEQAKASLPTGGSSQNVGTQLNDIKNVKAKALKSGSSDDWASYFAAKRQLASR